MPVCIAAREDHRWHSGLTPEQACNSEDTEAQKDLGLTQVVDAPRTLHFTPQEDATTNVFSYIFVVGDHYMHLEFRNKEVFWASAGERRIISMDPTTIVRYTPILNSRGPDPHDINEPFESVFTPLQRDGIPGVADWAETGSMPCPEREMKVTGFHAKWVKALINVGPNSVEHHAWILQSSDYGRRTFVGRIGGKYMILQKNKEGDEFGGRLGVWQPFLKKWKVKFSNGDVRKTPFDCQDIGYDGIWRGERDWRKFQLISVIGHTAVTERQYYVKAHEFTESEEAWRLF